MNALYKGSVLLISSCKVAVPNNEGSGMTEGVGGMPSVGVPSRLWPYNAHLVDLLEHNIDLLHHKCTTDGYSM